MGSIETYHKIKGEARSLNMYAGVQRLWDCVWARRVIESSPHSPPGVGGGCFILPFPRVQIILHHPLMIY